MKRNVERSGPHAPQGRFAKPKQYFLLQTRSKAQTRVSSFDLRPKKLLEFLYLDQEAVLAADVLDMHRAMDVVAQAHAMFAKGEIRQPHKIVLRNEKRPRAKSRAASTDSAHPSACRQAPWESNGMGVFHRTVSSDCHALAL